MPFIRFVLLLLCCLGSVAAQSDWPSFGRDPGAMRYSPLDEINVSNVARLQHSWTFHSGAPGSETTPVVIDGVMYLTQPNGIFALEPETGKQLWMFEAKGAAIRGLAYWAGSGSTGARVFAGVRHQLMAIDVATGKPAREFGDEGRVNLKSGVLGDLPDARLSLNSPPAVYKNIIITGSTNGEGAPSAGAYGDIRGWDARTGELVWTFHTVPRDGEPGSETWPDGGWKNRAGVNAWGFLTVDIERGLVYVPTGSPTTDFYGADRHGDGLYGNTLLALDAATGKLRWHQQLVHHDIWDYDLAAAPALIRVRKDGQEIPAVAQVTKMGLLFLFNRVTGEPIHGMEEREVPQSEIPGEATSPTQPFPVKPPPVARNTFREEEIYDLSPEHAAFCRDLYERNNMVIGPPYSPLPLEGNALFFPSTLGGGNWGGVSFDPTLGYLFTNVMNVGQFGHMEKRTDEETGEVTYKRTSEYGAYARFWNPDTHIPCSKPPFGELVAVNVDTGDIAWKTPLGRIPSLEAKGVMGTGAVNLGGSIATAGGLVFIAASNDAMFRAFESATGRLLWEHRIDSNGHAIPMTYRGKDGKQYVAIMAGGGGGFFRAPLSDSIMAFALGDGPPEGVTSAPRPAPVPAEAYETPASGTRYTAETMPEGKGRAVVQRLCGASCHGVEIFSASRLDKQGWTTVVDAMVARGAPGSREELDLVIEYLTAHLGRAGATNE